MVVTFSMPNSHFGKYGNSLQSVRPKNNNVIYFSSFMRRRHALEITNYVKNGILLVDSGYQEVANEKYESPLDMADLEEEEDPDLRRNMLSHYFIHQRQIDGKIVKAQRTSSTGSFEAMEAWDDTDSDNSERSFSFGSESNPTASQLMSSMSSCYGKRRSPRRNSLATDGDDSSVSQADVNPSPYPTFRRTKTPSLTRQGSEKAFDKAKIDIGDRRISNSSQIRSIPSTTRAAVQFTQQKEHESGWNCFCKGTKIPSSSTANSKRITVSAKHEPAHAFQFLVEVILHLMLLKRCKTEFVEKCTVNHLMDLEEWIKRGCLWAPKSVQDLLTRILSPWKIWKKLTDNQNDSERFSELLWDACKQIKSHVDESHFNKPFMLYRRYIHKFHAHQDVEQQIQQILEDPRFALAGSKLACDFNMEPQRFTDAVVVEMLCHAFTDKMEACQRKFDNILSIYGLSSSCEDAVEFCYCVCKTKIILCPLLSLCKSVAGLIPREAADHIANWTVEKSQIFRHVTSYTMDDQETHIKKHPVSHGGLSIFYGFRDGSFEPNCTVCKPRQCHISTSSQDTSLQITINPCHNEMEAVRYITHVLVHLLLMKSTWTPAIAKLVHLELTKLCQWGHRGCLLFPPMVKARVKAVMDFTRKAIIVRPDVLRELVDSLWPVVRRVITTYPVRWVNKPLLLYSSFCTFSQFGSATEMMQDPQMVQLPQRYHCRIFMKQSLRRPGAEVEIFVVPFFGNLQNCIKAFEKVCKKYGHFNERNPNGVYFAIVTPRKALVTSFRGTMKELQCHLDHSELWAICNRMISELEQRRHSRES